MSIKTTTLPQTIAPIRTVTIKQIINCFPEKIPYEFNFWIAGKIARYGITSDNILFLIESKNFPSSEMMQYFNSMVDKLGINATVSNHWKNQRFAAIRLFNDGILAVDKETMAYKTMPTPIYSAPVIELKNVLEDLPKNIPWNFPIYLTGGLVKNGWSAHDVDMIVFKDDEDIDTDTIRKMKSYFASRIGCFTDIGKVVMKDREPVYLYKIYDNANICLP